jgi:small basic protein (TIGR04137 family)
MSVHKSLVVKSGLVRARNVFTRAERIEALSGTGRWKEGDSIYGLPKVRTRAKTKKVKKEKKVAAPADGAAPAEGAAAAPAAGAAGGKPDAKAAKPAAKGAKK